MVFISHSPYLALPPVDVCNLAWGEKGGNRKTTKHEKNTQRDDKSGFSTCVYRARMYGGSRNKGETDMKIADKSEFAHTSAMSYPAAISRWVALDEGNDHTGIYAVCEASGLLWPCRTVSQHDKSRHDGIVSAWAGRAPRN